MSRAAGALRGFDPANDTHYAISEDQEMKLRHIAHAASTIGLLMETVDSGCADTTEEDMAPVLYTLGYAISGALEQRVLVFPKRPT